MTRKKTYPYLPNYCVRPGETLQEVMDELHLSPRVLAVACGRMPIETLEGILDGSVKITEPLARGLALGTGVVASLWLNLERHYREALAAGKKDVSE